MSLIPNDNSGVVILVSSLISLKVIAYQFGIGIIQVYAHMIGKKLGLIFTAVAWITHTLVNTHGNLLILQFVIQGFIFYKLWTTDREKDLKTTIFTKNDLSTLAGGNSSEEIESILPVELSDGEAMTLLDDSISWIDKKEVEQREIKTKTSTKKSKNKVNKNHSSRSTYPQRIFILMGAIIIIAIMLSITDNSNKKQSQTQVVEQNQDQNNKIYIRKVQGYLNHLGYNAGQADGIYGGKTVSAVMDFQNNLNWPQDGILSQKLTDKLVDRLSNPSQYQNEAIGVMPVDAKVTMRGNIFMMPNNKSKKLITALKGSSVRILCYGKLGYWKVQYGSFKGYLSEFYIEAPIINRLYQFQKDK